MTERDPSTQRRDRDNDARVEILDRLSTDSARAWSLGPGERVQLADWFESQMVELVRLRTEVQPRPRCVFARLETICGCIRFISLSMTLGPDGEPQSVDIPILGRDGIKARTFRRDYDVEGCSGGEWAVGDVMVLAYREDA